MKPRSPSPQKTPLPHEEKINVREVHQAIVRELPEPKELYKNIPWYLRHFYAILIIWLVIYLISLAGRYDWSSFDTPMDSLEAPKDIQ
ncbi:MAG: hypothetical protein AAF558_03155 [Verrucomicrobiota bacterium]